MDVAVPGVDPRLLDVEVTPNELLVKAEMHRESTKEEKGEIFSTEFHSGNLFRTIAFPKKINPDKVKADFKNGVLKITAPISVEQQSRKVDIHAA